MQEGYSSIAPTDKKLSVTDFWFMNGWGDIDDVLRSLKPLSERFDPIKATHKQAFEDYAVRSRCTSIIKLALDMSELWVTHTTWSSYQFMLRIYKKYTFPLNKGTNSGVFFAGYPGLIASLDDWYTTSNGLVVTETTNDICNPKLFSLITSQALPYWIRAIVANRVATGGPEWVDIFRQWNSGTYNNQWIIVDFKLITREPKTQKLQLNKNSVTIMEIIPGDTTAFNTSAYRTEDMSSRVTKDFHWFSYNRPYYPTFYKEMGYQALAEKFGDKYDNIFNYELNPRALILQRDVPNVVSQQDIKRIVQYNDYENDPIESGYAGNAIAARFDLKAGPPGTPYNDWFYRGVHGGIDSKVTSFSNFEQKGTNAYGDVEAISGPTHQQQPVFCWKDWPNQPHEGQPECFNFDWQQISPKDKCSF
eukprot:TRINITY_DN66792_c6_g2_i1.p1 TRINITY_DN66792_c6_g2~~TRINITY_DN66792_c6_g2_i1.p1  ORF type:complete len:448 (-),score=31.62 TRINITY_DN66792_c6_g2_i1:210-1466(-)